MVALFEVVCVCAIDKTTYINNQSKIVFGRSMAD